MVWRVPPYSHRKAAQPVRLPQPYANCSDRGRLVAFGLLILEFLVRNKDDAVQDKSNENRAANEPREGCTGVAGLRLMSAHVRGMGVNGSRLRCVGRSTSRSIYVSDTNRDHGIVGGNGRKEFDAFGDLAEHCMNAVQMACVAFAQHHEELAATGILASVSHRHGANGMLVRIASRFTLDLPARATRSNATITSRQIARKRITALHDKVRNDAVEFHPIIKAGVGQLLKVCNSFGRFGRVQLGDQRSLVRFKSGQFGHGILIVVKTGIKKLASRS